VPVTALRAFGFAEPPRAADARQPATPVAALLRGFSIEAVEPGASEIEGLASALPPGTSVFLPAVTARTRALTVEAAVRLRARGLEPVPHLAARDVTSHAALEDELSRLARWAGVRRAVVIGGERSEVAGPFACALDLIESGLLQRCGIAEIGVAGYPEGHPRLAPLVLERALAACLEAAEQTGLRAGIVTRFSFDAAAIVRFVRRLRDRGFENPVRIGLAGPAGLGMLLLQARRCGVQASVQGLVGPSGLLKGSLAVSAPDRIVDDLARLCSDGALGQVAVHFRSFGGAVAAARWAAAAARGA